MVRSAVVSIQPAPQSPQCRLEQSVYKRNVSGANVLTLEMCDECTPCLSGACSMRIGNLTEGEGLVQSCNLTVCVKILLRGWNEYCRVGPTGLGLACCT